MSEAKGIPLEFTSKPFTSTAIRRYEDFPGILSLKCPQIEYVVPALAIPRKSVVHYCGRDGTGKTYLCEALCVAVARGEEFLGERCPQRPTLYLDLENPLHTVQSRFRKLIGDDNDLPFLKVSGNFSPQPPPRAGSELLLEIARQVGPLIVIDTFRSFHDGKENESDSMACVMTYLRALAEYGATVVVLHHPSKSAESNGRGSSVIHAACDVALMHSLDPESGLITIQIEKNRNGANRTLLVRSDFVQGTFERTDSPYIAQRNEELKKLAKIINANPRSTQNTLVEKSGMNRKRVGDLLKEETGKLWTVESGPKNAKLYSSISVVLKFPEPVGTTGTTEPGKVCSSSGSLPTGGRTAEPLPASTSSGSGSREPLSENEKTLPSCPACGSSDVYRERDGSTSCLTCEGKIQ